MQKNKKVAIGLIQASAPGNIGDNMKKSAAMVKIAAQKGAKIICLQELYRTNYFPQLKKADFRKIAEAIPGESTRLFSKIAKETRAVVIVPVFEKTGADFYNSAAVIDADGKIIDIYRKIHIPHDPLFYEKNYFMPGNFGYRVCRTKYANFSVLICYDQWFPEAARISVLEGADILFYPTAIGRLKDKPEQEWEGDWREAWETVQRAHAIANGVYVAAVNRVGVEGNLKFWGSSFVCDSFGKIIKKASVNKEEILVADLDLGMNKKIREDWGFLKNRRPDTYQKLLQ